MFDQASMEKLSPEQQKEIEKKVIKAKARLILDHPFFGMAVSKRDIIYCYNTPTASMDAVGQMRLNPHFVSKLSQRNVIFLLAHEAMHFMLSHSTRRGVRDPEMWNIAADQVINDTLIDAKVGDFIEGGCHFDGARDKSTEELYNDPPPDDGSGSGGGIGLDIGDAVDEHGNPLDESKIKELEAKAKVEAIQCSAQAKKRGKLPASLERMIDELVHVKTPWYDILERYFNGKIRDGWSWKRPNRRFVGRGIYLPGVDYTPRMGKFVAIIDTSCSIGQPELNVFGGHINRIIEQCNPESITVIYCDAEVNHVDTYEPEDLPLKLTPHGGGGTAFKPAFDYIDEHNLDPEIVVYLTDGYGDQNDFTSKHDTIWLTTACSEFEWGTVVEFDVDA
jgi:predicted metal-dependent peptidase